MTASICPGCHEEQILGAEIREGQQAQAEIGDVVPSLCFTCGEMFVVTLTAFGWVARALTPDERREMADNPFLNRLRTEYAEFRTENPHVWDEA